MNGSFRNFSTLSWCLVNWWSGWWHPAKFCFVLFLLIIRSSYPSSSTISTHFKINLFIWKAEIQREILHLLFHFHNNHNSQGRACSKPVSKCFINIPHMGAGVMDHAVFPRALAESWIRNATEQTWTCLHMKLWHHRQQLYPPCHSVRSNFHAFRFFS